MGLDYYEILELTRSAKDLDIKKSYRKLALKYHPDIRNDEEARDKFLLIATAYDTLSDPQRKAIFDKFGAEGLEAGVPTVDGEGFAKGYTFHGDAMKVFSDFFGGDNPFADFYDMDGEFMTGFGGFNGRGKKRQSPPVHHELHLTLEEIFHGCNKKIQITRSEMNQDGFTTVNRVAVLNIDVKPGCKLNTKIIFKEEGDQKPNNIPSDLIFVVKEKLHSRFRRQNDDIIFTAKIPLVKALVQCSVEVPTLDGRKIEIPVNNVIHPGFTTRVVGEGMPKVEDPSSRGDLIIEFFIEFPKELTIEQEKLISKALLI